MKKTTVILLNASKSSDLEVNAKKNWEYVNVWLQNAW
jgi:hypothetical protein